MLASLASIRGSLPYMWILLPLWLLMSVFSFVVGCFWPDVSRATCEFLFFMCVGVGLCRGAYVTYRATYDSIHSLHTLCFGFPLLFFVFPGSAVALAVVQFGRPDLRWLAFWTNAACMLASFMIGMCYEAKRIGWRLDSSSDQWRESLAPFLDLENNLVKTTKIPPPPVGRYGWVIPLGVNIPLMFELFGGGRLNAIYLAAPLLVGTFAYLGIKVGPGLLRLFLLIKIENERGYRFANADYEQIQELRRHFRFARWLMKDYRPPQSLPDPFASSVRSRTALKRIAAQHDKTRRLK